LEVLFSPPPGIPARIAAAIDAAQLSIYVCMYHFTESTIAQHMASAVARGVDCCVIIDHRAAYEVNSMAWQLAKTGQVRHHRRTPDSDWFGQLVLQRGRHGRRGFHCDEPGNADRTTLDRQLELPPIPLHRTATILMASLPAYRPSNGSTCTIAAGVWTAAGRPTVAVSVHFDARLLMQFVADAARNGSHVATWGLGNPRATCTLT
jgi:hypothetical protein